MSLVPWVLADGTPLIDGSGNPILCESCPCSDDDVPDPSETDCSDLPDTYTLVVYNDNDPQPSCVGSDTFGDNYKTSSSASLSRTIGCEWTGFASMEFRAYSCPGGAWSGWIPAGSGAFNLSLAIGQWELLYGGRTLVKTTGSTPVGDYTEEGGGTATATIS
jgi:hypothetical protein